MRVRNDHALTVMASFIADARRQESRIAKEITDRRRQVEAGEASVRESLEVGLARERRALDILQEQREGGEITRERFLERAPARHAEIARIEAELANLDAVAPAPVVGREEIAAVLGWWGSADTSPADQRDALELIVSMVRVSPAGEVEVVPRWADAAAVAWRDARVRRRVDAP